jgi:hypothetical protein
VHVAVPGGAEGSAPRLPRCELRRDADDVAAEAVAQSTVARAACRTLPEGRTQRWGRSSRPLLKRIDALADRATSHAHYVLKSAPGAPIVVRPWAHADVDLARLVDPRIRVTDAAPNAWWRPVPADFLASLPAEAPTLDDGDSDPNRFEYFSQAGRLYRVARPFFCTGARGCAFRDLSAAEVAEPASGDCAEGTMNCQTLIYSDGRAEHTRADPSLTAMSGLLCPRAWA